MKRLFILIISATIISLSGSVYAQGDGPRSWLFSPIGLWGVNAKWIDMNQNLLPTGNILVKDAKIKVDVFPTTFFHTFGIKGRFAQVLFMVNPGSASGRLVPSTPSIPISQLHLSASGFSDGFLSFKLGLIGAPALTIKEFAEHKPAFSMMGYFRVWYSGTYDNSKPLNLGTNRTTFEFALPMNVNLFSRFTRPVWLEIVPTVQLYTANNNPTLITMADKSQQHPLFIIENHLTHNLTKRFWAGIDLRYQYGGVLALDGEKQDNKINILGGGISAGYQFLPFLSGSASYGTILIGDNNAYSDMFRLSTVFVYANTKKAEVAK
jgi:hypothetical protein